MDAEEFKALVGKAENAMKAVATAEEKAATAERIAADLRTEIKAMRAEQLAAAAANEYVSAGDREVSKYYTHKASADLSAARVKGRLGGGAELVKAGDVVVRFYGAEVDGLYRHGLLDDPTPKSEWQKELQVAAEEYHLVKTMTRGSAPKAAKRLKALAEQAPAGIRDAFAKMFADNSGEGAELIPDVTLPELQRAVEGSRTLETLFPNRNVSGGATKIPFLTTGAQAFIRGVPEAGELNPSELEKSQIALQELAASPVTFKVAIPIDMDAAEDSILDSASLLRMLAAEALRDGKEDAIISGDTAATHQDAIASWNPRSRWPILGSPNDHRKAFRGLRAIAYDRSATASKASALTAKDWMQDKLQLGVGHTPADVVHLCGLEYLIVNILGDSNLLTVDKMGQLATLLTGSVGSIGGSQVVLSDFMTPDLASSGLYTGSGSTAGRLTFNRNRFEIRRRRGLRMAMEVKELKGTMYLIVDERTTFAPLDPDTKKSVFYGYNLTTA